jgi:hypothetical protein
VLRRWTAEHLGSDLYRRSSDGHNGATLVKELASEKADVAAASHDAPSSEQATLGVPAAGTERASPLSGQSHRCQAQQPSGAKRVIKHGGQETALNDSGRIQERVGSSECNK